MKKRALLLLGIIPFFSGCTSTTTIKAYSVDFKVTPIETKDAGKTIVASDGTKTLVRQQYKFDAKITETTKSPNGQVRSRVIASPSLTAPEGVVARMRVGEGVSKKGTVKNGTALEAKIEDLGTEYKAYLKTTIQKGEEEPVSCSQTITIQK